MLQHLINQDEGLRMVPIDRNELTTAVDQLRAELRALPTGSDLARTRVLTRWIGIGQMSLGNHDEARTFLRQSLDLAAAIGNTRAVVATGLNLGDAHRYAGDVQTADALYRSALSTARSQHPELVDFALQHTGKHLMERGDLAGAQAHLQEALRLRIVKGDAGLVESTQAALARVELLIGQADTTAADGVVPRQWSGQWTCHEPSTGPCVVPVCSAEWTPPPPPTSSRASSQETSSW
ncbi:tetratricopeptide (TPR) repeat protein [Kitasatospora sp. MAP12-15]|uniref:tetratricopeptide repeat protein n=1 Tax=unclassified Kitasatospora TaxID=2633591 RepID=UPI0024734929|nr:tetratricopeptide repeat protein [Kitasatospora sp. MAP12-44]MDH6108876.1 tetratricopeptide (TPR) repeat protein [Kitasatospora sp. MAP12-44]